MTAYDGFNKAEYIFDELKKTIENAKQGTLQKDDTFSLLTEKETAELEKAVKDDLLRRNAVSSAHSLRLTKTTIRKLVDSPEALRKLLEDMRIRAEETKDYWTKVSETLNNETGINVPWPRPQLGPELDALLEDTRDKVRMSERIDKGREAWLGRRLVADNRTICTGHELQIEPPPLPEGLVKYETILTMVIDAMRHSAVCEKVEDASGAAEFAVKTAKAIFDLG